MPPEAIASSSLRRSALRRLSYVLGGVATAPLMSGLLAGCSTPGGSDLAAYQFQTLSEPQQNLLAALVDQIIPATDTPGAAEAGVPQFVDHMLADWYAPEERDAFLAGLDAVDRRAEGSFVGLDDAARATLVEAMDAETYGEQPGAVGSEAWVIVLTLAWVSIFMLLPLFNKDRLRAGDMVGGTWVESVPKKRLRQDLAGSDVASTAWQQRKIAQYQFSQEQLEAYGIFELQTLETV